MHRGVSARITYVPREAAIMADVSLPGDTGAFMDGISTSARDGGEGGESNLRRLRTQQAKARRKSKDRAKNSKRQVR